MKKSKISQKEFWDVLINGLGWHEKDYGRVLNLLAGDCKREEEECESGGFYKASKAYAHDFETIYKFLEKKGYYGE